jgi:hypothetical protein
MTRIGLVTGTQPLAPDFILTAHKPARLNFDFKIELVENITIISKDDENQLL